MSTGISYEEAQRAIYFDVEGRAPKKRGAEERPPVLAGVLIDGQYQAVLLKEDLRGAADAKGLDCMSLKQVLRTLKKKATEEGRKIVYFTSKEKKLFTDMGEDVSDCAVDLRDLCKRNKTYEKVRKEWSGNTKTLKSKKSSKTNKKKLRTKSFGLLTLFAAEAGLPRISGYGAGKVGQWISYFEKQAQKKDTYEKWTPSAKIKLSWLIKHNKHDVEATQFAMKYLLGQKSD